MSLKAAKAIIAWAVAAQPNVSIEGVKPDAEAMVCPVAYCGTPLRLMDNGVTWEYRRSYPTTYNARWYCPECRSEGEITVTEGG